MKIGVAIPGLRYLGGGAKHGLCCAHVLAEMGDVDIISDEEVSPDHIKQCLGIDCNKFHIKRMWGLVDDHSLKAKFLYRIGRLQTEELRIRSEITRKYDIYLETVISTPTLCKSERGILVCFFPFDTADTPDAQQRVQSYSKVLSISKFTQHWLKKRWNVDSEITYPPVDVESIRRGNKEKRILALGRFFAGGHSKKHFDMIRAFKAIEKSLPGWELHLVGHTHPAPEHAEYLAQVKAEAQGSRVVLHTDMAQEDMEELLSTSAIFWHAAGWDVDENVTPEKCEHFGIAVVEAMAAGCVTFAPNKGGPKELIAHGSDGFLWNDLENLQSQTVEIASDPARQQLIADRAVESCQRFSLSNFNECFRQVVERM